MAGWLVLVALMCWLNGNFMRLNPILVKLKKDNTFEGLNLT